jgi:putative membrane protein
MNRGLKLSLAVSLALLATTACQRDAETVTDNAAQPGTPATSSTPAVDDTGAVNAPAATAADTSAAPPGAPAAGALSQGQAVAMVGAVDKHEIAAAEQAKSKKVTGDVADFANMLHSEHSRNLEAGQKLGVAQTSAEVTSMEEKGRADLAMLGEKSGKDYEKAYVDAMVKGHEEALSLLDSRLLPAATDENVRTFLNNSRDHVAMHLERAKALQQKAGGAP